MEQWLNSALRKRWFGGGNSGWMWCCGVMEAWFRYKVTGNVSSNLNSKVWSDTLTPSLADSHFCGGCVGRVWSPSCSIHWTLGYILGLLFRWPSHAVMVVHLISRRHAYTISPTITCAAAFIKLQDLSNNLSVTHGFPNRTTSNSFSHIFYTQVLQYAIQASHSKA